MIKGLLFDYDDTLSDRGMSAYLYYCSILKRLFPEIDPASAEFEARAQQCMTWDEFGRIDKAHVFEEIKKHYDSSLDVEAEKEKWYDSFYQFQVIQPGCYEILKKLKKRYKLGIVTNGNGKTQNIKIDTLKLRDYFDTVLVSGDFKAAKPDPSIYMQAASDLDLQCSEIAFIGDTFATDLLGAVNVGMMPLWFCYKKICATQYPVTQLHAFSDIEDMFLIHDEWNKE